MSTTRGTAAEAPTEAAELYLGLMKRVLTRHGFDDSLRPVVPRDRRRRRAWSEITRLLARRDLVVLKRWPEYSSARVDGRDWPVNAETMVGLKRLDNIQHCVTTALADGIPGDLLEAGVWRGGSAIFMRAVLAALGDHTRRVWVADSFEGLPAPDGTVAADADDEHWTYDYLAVDAEQVRRNFERYDLLDDQVQFLPGWFSDTLPTAPIDRLAVLRADGDMYGSTMDILTALYWKVSPGGFVIIDDYGAIPGCKSAVEDFREQNAITEEIVPIDWTGVYWRRAS